MLDEPTTHLDLPNKAALLQLLSKLAHAQGKCILYSTHDLDLALQLSDEIILMKKGTVTHDSPQNLTDSKAFDQLFEGSPVVFDYTTKTFRVL